MKDNAHKVSLRNNSQTMGCWVSFGSPAVTEAIAHSGFDWILIDCEHSPNDDNDVIHQMRAIDAARANGASAEAIVRVPWNDAVMVKRVMDSGVQTIMFPAVDNVEQAKQAVASMKFSDGKNGGLRGIAGITRAGKYGLDPQYMANANTQACAVIQIETAEGLKNVREIAQVDGVDCLFIGPTDLSAQLCHFGEYRHPVMLDAIETIVKAARDAGKAVGVFAASAEDALFYSNKGVTMISLHSDVGWLAAGTKAAIAEYKRLI